MSSAQDMCEECCAAADSQYPPCEHCGQIICPDCYARHMLRCAPMVLHASDRETGNTVTIGVPDSSPTPAVVEAHAAIANLLNHPFTQTMLHALDSGCYLIVFRGQLAQMRLDNSGDRPVADINNLGPTHLREGHCAQQ